MVLPRCSCALLLLVATTVHAGDWPQWLGAQRDGSTDETVKPWKAPLKTAWRQPVGEGNSSPVIVNGVVYLHQRVGTKNEEALVAYDATGGKILWSESYPRANLVFFYGNGPRGTPAVADGKVYTFGITGVLTCFDAKSGKQVWQVDSAKEFKAPKLTFGASCSPLIEGDKLLVNVGGKGASIVAFDRNDGKVLWKSLDDGASYASPIALGKGEDRQAVFLTAKGLTSIAVRDGKMLWQVPMVDLLLESSTTPVRSGDFFFASTITLGGVGIKVDGGPGAPKAVKVWEKPELNCYFSTPVAVGNDHLFMVTGTKPSLKDLIPGGKKKPTTADLRYIETATGKELWMRPKVGTYHASLTRTADNKLLLLEEGGELVLLDPNPKEYRELCRSKICGNTWAHPAVAQGRLYIRDGKELVCVELP